MENKINRWHVLSLVILTGSMFLFYTLFDGFRAPIFSDEISGYFLPTLNALDSWKTVFFYDYKNFFGHPPLFPSLLSVSLRLFPRDLVTLRFTCVFFSVLGFLPLFLIGRFLAGPWAGVMMVALEVSHWVFLENANLILPDNLFNTLFLFYLLFYLQKKNTPMLITGFLMILTRENSLLVFAVMSGYDFVRYRVVTKNFYLLALALSWLLSLKVATGYFTPVFHEDKFFLTAPFIADTLFLNLRRLYGISSWHLLLLPIVLLRKRGLGFLLLVPVTSLLALSTITSSETRYQLFGLSCVCILSVVTLWEKESFRKWGWGLTALLFFWNVFFSVRIINHGTYGMTRQDLENFYRCAERVNKGPQGAWVIQPYPLGQLSNHYEKLTHLQLLPSLTERSSSLSYKPPTTVDDLKEKKWIAIQADTRGREKPFLKLIEESAQFHLLSNENGCYLFERAK